MIIDKDEIIGCNFEEKGSLKIMCFDCMFNGYGGFSGLKKENILTYDIEGTRNAYICDFCSKILNRM